MGSPLPPDPYAALGVSKDATAAQIKQVYRKAVLKFHPDKVTDESQKQAASDKFHQIQSSYEIIGDEERRARYDAQVKLAELRKDVMNRQGASSTVSVPKGPPSTPGRNTGYTNRGAGRTDRPYQAQEVRPGPGNDYFDIPRASSRKDTYEHDRDREREARRTPPRAERERPKMSAKEAKEYAKMGRRDSDRRSSRDTRRDRDIKESARYAPSMMDDDSDSESDDSYACERERERERHNRRRREEEDRERERERANRARERERFYEQQRRQDESYFAEERARKVSSQESGARDYIDRSVWGKGSRQAQEIEDSRPSPQRKGSSRDQVEYIKRGEGRPPVMVRRGSDRPRSSESPRRASTREARRSSADIVEEPRRAPPLQQSRSSPDQIRIPGEKARAQSLQTDSDRKDEPPRMKRAETMPTQAHASNSRRKESTAPTRSSGLRQTETNDGDLPTPGATPDYPASRPSKYSYGREYADDREFPTPDGYRTEIIEPANGKPTATPGRFLNRSPSPIAEERTHEPRQQTTRAASSRYPETRPHPPRLDTSTRSTSYKWSPNGVQALSPEAYSPKSQQPQQQPTSASSARPKLVRGDSMRSSTSRQQVPLYGEVGGAPSASRGSPVQAKSRHPPSAGHEGVQYQPEIKAKDVKYQTGYSQQRRGERPAYATSRSNSYSQQPVYAR